MGFLQFIILAIRCLSAEQFLSVIKSKMNSVKCVNLGTGLELGLVKKTRQGKMKHFRKRSIAHSLYMYIKSFQHSSKHAPNIHRTNPFI